MRRKFIAPNVLLRTGLALLGTTIIRVAFLDFGGNHHAAPAATHDTTKRLGFFSGFLGMAALDHNLLDFIEQPLFDDGRVPSFIHLPDIAEQSDIEGVGKNKPHVVFVKMITVPTLNAVIEEEIGNVFKTGISLCIQLESGSDNFGLCAVDDDGFRPNIVYIADRSDARELAASHLLVEAAFRIRGQIENKLIRHAKLDRHHKDVIVRIVIAVVSANVLDDALLKHPTHLSAVHRIASKPI